MADSAEDADSVSEKLTKPNPLDLPVSLSVITLAIYIKPTMIKNKYTTTRNGKNTNKQ